MRAAIASMLEIPFETTPEGDLEAWDKWASENNGRFAAFDFSPSNPTTGYTLGLVELDGDPPKTECSGLLMFEPPMRNLHVVVLRDGKVVHDPHRDQSALGRKLVQEQIVVPIDPARRMTFRDSHVVAENVKHAKLRRSVGTSTRKREFIRALRRKRMRDRWVERVLESWALVDAEEIIEPSLQEV